MATLIKNIQNKNKIEFDTGAFDNWCVYLTRHGQRRYAPRDNEYFLRLKQLGCIHGHQKVYADFIKFYSLTNKQIALPVLTLITELANTYFTDAEEIDIWFTVIYSGMVAEENKANTVLGKRIKRLGMHQVLIENMEPNNAATFSKGKKWMELDTFMKQRGF